MLLEESVVVVGSYLRYCIVLGEWLVILLVV